MPSQKQVSKLAQKYGQKLGKAVTSHAGDETDYGFVRIPGGITNGVAKLTKCYFDQYKEGKYKGEYYMRAVGVVVEPKEIETPQGRMKVEGLQTSIMIPVCQTTNSKNEVTTMEENVAKILNELRKLGVDTEGASAEELEALAASAADASPYFRFSTSQSEPTAQFPNPRVWENWNGTKGVEDFVEGEAEDEQEDNTEAAEEEEVTEEQEEETAEEETSEEESEESEEESETEEEGPDLDELAKVADGKDKKKATPAQAQLEELAKEAGIDESEVEGADNWTAVVDMIRAKQEESGEDANEEQEEEEWKPAKGDVYVYKPIDPKTKKPVKKGSECEVTGVDPKKETCTVKCLDTKKVYSNVKWTDLSQA